MINNNYRSFFGLKKQPFGADISINDILKTAELIEVKDRFDYVIRIGAIGLVTGEVGSVLDRLDPTNVDPGRGVELECPATRGRLR